jgi:hypothetical protein
MTSLLLAGSLVLVCAPGAPDPPDSPGDERNGDVLAPIALQNRTIAPTRGVEAAVADALAARSAGDRSLPVIVALRRQPTAADREVLERQGIQLESWLGGTSYRASVEAGRPLEAGGQDALLIWVGAVAPADRMARNVFEGTPPDWAVTPDGRWRVEVALRQGVDDTDARSLLSEHAAVIQQQQRPPGQPRWAIEIAPDAVRALATDDRVERLEFGPDPMMPLPVPE